MFISDSQRFCSAEISNIQNVVAGSFTVMSPLEKRVLSPGLPDCMNK